MFDWLSRLLARSEGSTPAGPVRRLDGATPDLPSPFLHDFDESPVAPVSTPEMWAEARRRGWIK
jgi:hypothetical protein